MSLFTLHTGMDSFPDKNFNHIYSTDTVLKLCSEDSFNNILEQTLYTRTFTLCSEGDLKATHVHTYVHTCLASSAAGHYVPAIGAEIVTSNSLYAQNLKGIGELNAPHTAQGTSAQGQVVHGANTYVRMYVRMV